MINKMISSKSVMSKIIADLDLDEDDIRIADIREWIGEAILYIGAPTQLNHKVVVLPLKNYQVKLPCDLEKIDFVAYSFWEKGGWIPMKKSTGYFSVTDKYKRKPSVITEKEYVDNKPEEEGDEIGFITEDGNQWLMTEDFYNLVLEQINQNIDLNDVESNKSLQQTVEDTFKRLYRERIAVIKRPFVGSNFSPRIQYDLKPGYLFSNVPKGYIKLSYYATYTDEEGMPMIPDNQSYFEAIFWYVAMKLLYIDYFKGNKPQHLYYDAKRSYNFYRKQAYAEAMMPDQNDIMNISKTWHTLVPEIDSQDTFLSTTGDSQIIHNQNSIWR